MSNTLFYRPFRYLMASLIFITGILPLASGQHQQWFKSIPSDSEAMPAWARMMYAESPNVRQVDSAYQAYYDHHEFEKNMHTQNYRHWRPKIEPYLNEEGVIVWPSPKAVLKEEMEYKNLLSQRNGNGLTAEWQNLGPFETYNQGAGQFPVSWQANVYTIDQSDSHPEILYCGTESGGVFKTEDSGMNWQHASANTMMNNVRIVRIATTNPEVVYAGTSQRVYRTQDGGNSWEVVLDAASVGVSSLGINAIAIAPVDENRIIAAGTGGLWHTENGGASWNHPFTNAVYDIAFKPDDASVLYLVRRHSLENRCEFLKSTDGGHSWEVKSEGWYLPAEDPYEEVDRGAKIAVSALAPNLVIAGLIGDEKPGDDGYLGLWKSTDAGGSWLLQGPHVGGPYEYNGGPSTHKNIMKNEGGGGPYQGFYDYVLAISPFDTSIVYIGGVSLYQSTDGGATFNVIGGYQGNTWIHPDMQEIATGPDGVWLANDGGIQFSNDEFATMESRKNGLTASEFWGFGSAWNEDLLVGGRYHNGNTSLRPSYGPGNALRLGGAEAPTGYVQPGGPGIAYFSDISSQIIPPSLDGNVLQAPSLSKYPAESYFAAHSSELEFAPYCYNHMYLGKDNQLWKSEDGGSSFEAIGTFGDDSNAPILQFELSRSNPEVIYVYQRTSFYGAHLWKTTNGGASWEMLDFPAGPGSMRAGGLAINPQDEEELWVFFAHQNNDGAKVYKTEDGGNSWENVTTETLDGHSVRTLLFQAGTAGNIYLGTDKAVFYRSASMPDWELCSQGLPMRTNTNLFRPFYRENKLRVGTYSNGIWETEFVEPSGLIVQPTVDKLQAGCTRDTFYLDDYSVLQHQGASWLWEINPAPDYISDADIRNPKVVFGSAGTYEVVLTVTDAGGQQASRALPVISVEACQVDSIPGMALSMQDAGDYAAVSGLPLAGNELTITAWIRPDGAQPDYTGIFIAESESTAGINFRPGMELGYHWPGGAWWWSSQLIVPENEWSYVAMVVRPDSITLYLNGASAVHLVDAQAIDWQDAILRMGSYNGWTSRNYSGLMDEVKVYNRALSTEEIRKGRHLTADGEETGLIAYYQFNEQEGAALNKTGTQHAGLVGTSTRIPSTASVGSGHSSLLLIENEGNYTFDSTGVQMVFEGSNIPDGPVAVTRLNISPDVLPGAMPVPEKGYWIVNGYGNNEFWEGLSALNFSDISLPTEASGQADAFRIFRRAENGEGDSWEEAGSATAAQGGINNSGRLEFGPPSDIHGSGQLIVEQGALVSNTSRRLPGQHFVYPNPVRKGESLFVLSQLTADSVFELYDSNGKRLYRDILSNELSLEVNWPAGIYQYSIKTPKHWFNGRVVVVE
jgi:photosystem II stability/assembly factor-like uncharacterized protein/PKD repeat protein